MAQGLHPGHDGERVGAGGVDDHAGGEEQQRLEGAVREEVEDGGTAVADGEGAGHVAELADRRVGEDALDVVLGERGEPRADHRDSGHDGEDDHRGRGGLEDGEEPGDEVDAGGDHRRGVDQRGDGCGARHRVGQPGVQREQRRLARHAREEQQGDQGRVVQSAARDGAEDAGDPEGAGVGGQREQADEEGDVAELGDQEGLDGGGAGLGRLPVVADQEVRADAHDLPADQQHHQVAGVDDEQHRGGEQGDESGVRGVARVVAQIARRVDLHAGGDDADEYGDEGGEAVDVQAQLDGDRAGRGEFGVRVDGLPAALVHGATSTARTRDTRVGRTASGRTKPGAVRPRRSPAAAPRNGRRGTRTARVVVVTRWPQPSRPRPGVGCRGASGPCGRGSAVSRSLSMSEVPRLRYTARTIARPMPISAAAMAMVNRVRAWPECSVSRAA